MLCRLLIGLARFDLQNFAVGHSLGVAMQTAQFWTVLIMLSHASSGTHRPTADVVCRGWADCKQSTRAEGVAQAESFTGALRRHLWVRISMLVGASRQSSNCA